MRKEVEESEADERNLDVKIKKKQEELERTEKRVKSLENVRPQFMDEVDKLEKVRVNLLTHSSTYSLTVTYSLTHILTHSHTHSLTYALTHSLTRYCLIYSIIV